jgi:hypothetical protein
LILPKVSSVVGDFLVVIADLFSISTDFLLAGPVANIAAKLGFILSQLLEVASYFAAAFLHVFSGVAHVTKFLSNGRFVVMAAIALVFSTMSVTPVTRIIEARVSHRRSALGTMAIRSAIVTSPVLSIKFPVITIAPAVFISAVVLGVDHCRQHRK